jgi:DNA polymerase-3 subunit delta'
MSDSFGHEKQWLFLKKSASLRKLSHAYLFSGKPKLGKRKIALEFAKFLNCQDKDFQQRPCGKCFSCLETEKNCHPDFLLLETKEKTEESEIGSIRFLIDWFSLKPGLAEHRVAVIDQFQNFSLPAQSALLKTLEEPRGSAVLILVCDYPEFLSSTIISRLQEIRFFPLSFKETTDFLVSRGAKEPLAKRASLLSLGRPLKALELLEKKEMEAEEEKLESFTNLLAESLSSWFRQIEKMTENKEDLAETLGVWLNFLRLLFLKKIGSLKQDFIDERAFLTKGDFLALAKLKSFLSSLEKANYLLLRTNANSRLILENSVLELF